MLSPNTNCRARAHVLHLSRLPTDSQRVAATANQSDPPTQSKTLKIPQEHGLLVMGRRNSIEIYPVQLQVVPHPWNDEGYRGTYDTRDSLVTTSGGNADMKQGVWMEKVNRGKNMKGDGVRGQTRGRMDFKNLM